jgi:flagellar hook assembly protein FlgD
VQGSHQISWDGRNAQGQVVPFGVYIYHIEAGSFVQSRKMILMK